MPALPATNDAWDHYPDELIELPPMARGGRVSLRPVRPEDEEALQAFFRSLSDDARRNRFFRAVRELSPNLIHDFTHLDYHARFALLATVSLGGDEVIIGSTTT